MESTFTPIPGLVGGAMIGFASALLFVALGRIAGISGILGRVLLTPDENWGWRALFLVGLILGAELAVQSLPSAAAFEITESPLLLIAGGLLVGYGTQLGSGCTSGHGVCGLARLSRRSLVAVPVFIAAAMLTVAVAQRWDGN